MGRKDAESVLGVAVGWGAGMSSVGGISMKREAGIDDGTAKKKKKKNAAAPAQLVLCTSPQAAIRTPESEEVWRWRQSECNLSSCLVDRGISVLLSIRLRKSFPKSCKFFSFPIKKKRAY